MVRASLVLSAAFLSSVHCVPDELTYSTDVLTGRALPDSPSGGYAPAVVSCPDDRPEIRLADGLSEKEESWVRTRRRKTIEPMRELIQGAKIDGFDVEAFFDNIDDDDFKSLPNIAMAFSGGGWRALMNGAGFLKAADSRSGIKDGIGGLLQATTYLSGLSGGGWLVGSVFANNFSTIGDLQRRREDTGLWRFDRGIWKSPITSGVNLFRDISYWHRINSALRAKGKLFDPSITDLWGRQLSHQLIDDPNGGAAYTFSSIAESDHFTEGETPFPILVADGRKPGEKIISLNSTVYEFNPFELGTWDQTTFGFAPIKYLGSTFKSGSVSDKGECVRGFDQFGFIMGTSSSLFNAFALQIRGYIDIPIATTVVEWLLNLYGRTENDIAQYKPNPFSGWNPTSRSVNSEEGQLSLVDGGEDLQNIPLQPLIQNVRKVDIIFAVDSSMDTKSQWPDGTSLRATFDRSKSDISNGSLFPPIPSERTFISQGLNRLPTLFGCDADNLTQSADGSVAPLVFYIPNAPYSALSNISTFQPQTSEEQRDEIILNGVNTATQGNNTVDKNWTTCVACAILSRSWWRSGEEPPKSCEKCFDKYCWDGKEKGQITGQYYYPEYIIPREKEKKGFFGRIGDRLSGLFGRG